MLGNMGDKERLYKIGKMILHESELEIQVPYKGDIFTLRYPEPWRQAQIESEIARRLGGFPRSSFSIDHVNSIEAYVTIDLTYIPEKCPDWFKNGPWECYDPDLVIELIKGFFLFRDKFAERIRGSGPEGGGTSQQS